MGYCRRRRRGISTSVVRTKFSAYIKVITHLHKILRFSTLHIFTSPLWPRLADAKYKPLGETAMAVTAPVDGWAGSTNVVSGEGA